MTQIATQIITKKRTNFILVLLFVLASCTSAFSQSVVSTIVESEVVTKEVNTKNVTTESSRSNSNFILWFMGSKQDPNREVSPEGINSKKDIITSGLAPNRLLLKAFLKKTVNLESTLV